MGVKIDLVGQHFGRLTVIERLGRRSKKRDTYWLCQCNCGGQKEVSTYSLRSGHTKSCGCLEQENKRKRKTQVDDYIGKRYGHLLILEEAEVSENGKVKVRCQCDCGNITVCFLDDLKQGNTKSCGCYRVSLVKGLTKTHGMSDTRLFKVWCLMHQRCYNINNPQYKNYGGRGITICDEWKNDFLKFHDWAYENGYDENADFMKCTLDRKDVNGNYCPENCRWATTIEQCNNKRNNTLVSYNGEIHTVAEWARMKCLNYTTLFCRLFYHGWSVEEALNVEPVVGRKRK